MTESQLTEDLAIVIPAALVLVVMGWRFVELESCFCLTIGVAIAL